MERAIETAGLRRTFNEVVAVDDLKLEVEAGTFYGFLGPNGAGKSTTITMLTGLVEPTARVVRVAGCEVVADPVEALKIAS